MFTYQGVTQMQVKQLVRELQNAGSAVTNPQTNAWRIDGHGVVATAVYTPSSQTLTVDIYSKPFWVPISAINAGILKALGRT